MVASAWVAVSTPVGVTSLMVPSAAHGNQEPVAVRGGLAGEEGGVAGAFGCTGKSKDRAAVF